MARLIKIANPIDFTEKAKNGIFNHTKRLKNRKCPALMYTFISIGCQVTARVTAKKKAAWDGRRPIEIHFFSGFSLFLGLNHPVMEKKVCNDGKILYKTDVF